MLTNEVTTLPDHPDGPSFLSYKVQINSCHFPVSVWKGSEQTNLKSVKLGHFFLSIFSKIFSSTYLYYHDKFGPHPLKI